MFHRANYNHPEMALEDTCVVLVGRSVLNYGPEHALLNQDVVGCIRQALLSLGAEQREALYLRFWFGEAVTLSLETGMVRVIMIWNVDFTHYGDDPQDGYALIRPDGGCPACVTLHEVLSQP